MDKGESVAEEKDEGPTTASKPSPASLRWRLLRQSLLPSSRLDLLSQGQTKLISRKPAGGFSLIPNCILEPKEEEYTGDAKFALSSNGAKDMMVEYYLPSHRVSSLILVQRRQNHVDLRDFEISKEHKIDNTGIVCLWPSEEVLAYFCISNSDMFRNKTVLELGSGYGLAGLAIAACTDAAAVVISDGNPQVVDYIQKNIDANVGSFGSTKVTSLLFHWGEGDVCHLGQSYDFILAADCTFFQEFHSNLVHTLKSLLRMSETAQAVFVSPKRGNTLDLFLQIARNLNLHVQLVENYDSHVWEMHNKFMEQDNSTWSNYDEEHCYPLLVKISLESEV